VQDFRNQQIPMSLFSTSKFTTNTAQRVAGYGVFGDVLATPEVAGYSDNGDVPATVAGICVLVAMKKKNPLK
jgi:hypothetical protein